VYKAQKIWQGKQKIVKEHIVRKIWLIPKNIVLEINELMW